MKRIILLLITFLCIFSPVALAQSGEIKRCTEEQLPLESRTDYIEQATEFLRSYYNQLMLNVDEMMVQKEFIKAHMDGKKQRYKPEFLLEQGRNVNFLLPDQYLQELEKQYTSLNADNIDITVDNIDIDKRDFFLPNLISCYLIANYDLTFTNDGETLFKRRCRAYCLFPKISVSIIVKLMQVEPVKDIIPYKPKSNDSILAPDDMDETNKALWQKALNGDVSAQRDLANKYYYGEGVKQDYTKAAIWYTKAAEQGDATAQCKLGLCYEYGKGVEKNFTEAVKWYTKAAEQGDATAQNNLGYCYEHGQGVEKNFTEAVKWYTKAAEQGSATAQYNLEVCYKSGQGVEKNFTETVKWYTKAAEKGYARAQNNLGLCYEYGKGVEKNFTEAVKWYTKAAEQGYARAQNNLGVCYEYGKGVEKNFTEAVKWYTKAAEKGNAWAQCNLGYCYEHGQGVEKNINKAIEWYKKSAKQNDEDAIIALKRLNVNIQ